MFFLKIYKILFLVLEGKSIEFNPVFSEKSFEVKIPADWVKVKRQYLDCEFLDTKF